MTLYPECHRKCPLTVCSLHHRLGKIRLPPLARPPNMRRNGLITGRMKENSCYIGAIADVSVEL